MFVIIKFLNNQPNAFVRRDFSISSLCTNFCLFDLQTLNMVELSEIPTHSVRTRFESFEIPENYSIYGKSPLEFLKACYKERAKAVPKIKVDKEIKTYAKAKKESSPLKKQGGLFEDLGENRHIQRTEMSDFPNFDIF